MSGVAPLSQFQTQALNSKLYVVVPASKSVTVHEQQALQPLVLVQCHAPAHVAACLTAAHTATPIVVLCVDRSFACTL